MTDDPKRSPPYKGPSGNHPILVGVREKLREIEAEQVADLDKLKSRIDILHDKTEKEKSEPPAKHPEEDEESTRDTERPIPPPPDTLPEGTIPPTEKPANS